jgi:hypothetical protein
MSLQIGEGWTVGVGHGIGCHGEKLSRGPAEPMKPSVPVPTVVALRPTFADAVV